MGEPSLRGVYDADRAAALSGVPKSTIYEWARKKLVVPSISPEKVKLWSWSDLVELRALYWLRHQESANGVRRKAVSMTRVVAVLHDLRSAASRLGDQVAEGSIQLRIDHSGMPFVVTNVGVTAYGPAPQSAAALQVDLLDSFKTTEANGPDLLRPAEGVRIIPGALAGEPHLDGTRIETRVLWSLRQRGFSVAQIADLYPDSSAAAIERAISFERGLSAGTKAA